jgi:hypothetical protein
MPKDTRDKVTLSPEAYKALEVEAMLHGTSLKDTASKLILKAGCPKANRLWAGMICHRLELHNFIN